MARNRRSFATRRTNTPSPIKPVCETWPVLERLAFHETTTRRLRFDEDVTTYREQGARAFGAWRYKIEDFGEERAFDLLKDLELTVSSLSWAGGFVYSDGEAYSAAIADALEAVETAATLEAFCLVVLPGTRGSYTPKHAGRMIIDALRQVGDAAGARGVHIALQPVDPEFAGDGCFLDTLDKLLEFLSDCDHPHIGLNLDLFHLQRTPKLVERVADLLPWIRLVQLSDCVHNPRSELDRCQLGAGTLPVAELVVALEAVGYRGFYDVPMTAANTLDGRYNEVLQHTRDTFEELTATV